MKNQFHPTHFLILSLWFACRLASAGELRLGQFPDWVTGAGKSSTRFSVQQSIYLKAARKVPYPPLRDALEDGMPMEYNAIKNKSEKDLTDLNRMDTFQNLGGRKYLPRSVFFAQLAKAIQSADDLHEYWATRIRDLGGFTDLPAKELQRYEADFKDFEERVVGLRAIQRYLSLPEKTREWDTDSLGEFAIRELVEKYRRSSCITLETKRRLANLAVKHPKLGQLLLEVYAPTVPDLKRFFKAQTH